MANPAPGFSRRVSSLGLGSSKRTGAANTSSTTASTSPSPLRLPSPSPASTVPFPPRPRPLPPPPPLPSAATPPPTPPPPPPPFSSSSFPSAPSTPSSPSSAPPLLFLPLPLLFPRLRPLPFALTLLSLALFPLPPSDPHFPRLLSPQTLTLPLSSLSLLHPLAAKSALLTLVYLLRFHALRYRGSGASILADLAGALASKSLSDDPRAFAGSLSTRRDRRISGLAALLITVSLLSFSRDRSGCFPLSSSPSPTEGCVRVAPILLPFVSGFLAYHERAAGCWASLRLLGRRRVELLDSRPHCCYPLRSGSGQFLSGGRRRWCGIGDECGMAADKYSVFWGDSG